MSTTAGVPSPLPTPAVPGVPGVDALAPNYLGPSVSYPTYIALLSQLIPLQRSLLLLNLQKAHYFYSIEEKERLALLGWAPPPTIKNDPILHKLPTESDEDFVKREKGYAEEQRKLFSEAGEEVKQVKDLLSDCGLWTIVRDKEEEADLELANWSKLHANGQQHPRTEFQVVQIGGVPFLLHLPPGYLPASHTAPSATLYRSWKRAQVILHILTTMLQLLITYQPSAPAIAYGRALLRNPSSATSTTHGGPAPHHHHHAAAAPGAPINPAQAAAAANLPRRRATISIVINLEAMLSILIPLVLLSIKLGFLLWIFGRHASSSKRVILFSMAIAYVIWEGWAMQRRRAAAGGAREREVRRRAAAAGVFADPRRAAAGAPAGGVAGADPANPQQPRQAGAAAGAPGDPARPTPRIREPTSRYTPRYWLNWIAAIGLADEARELGLVPRSIAGRPVTNPPPGGGIQNRRKRAIRTAIVAVVLFFGTLSPEVEKKRKRALEKREKLLASRKAARERKAIANMVGQVRAEMREENAAAGAGAGGQGGLEVPHQQQQQQDGGGRSGASTPGLLELENENPANEEATTSGGASTSTSQQTKSDVPASSSYHDSLDFVPPPPPPSATPSFQNSLPIPPPPLPPAASSTLPTTPTPTELQSLESMFPSTPTPTAATGSDAPQLGQPSTSTSTSTGNITLNSSPEQQPIGRALISDAELFADGLGEPDQEQEEREEEEHRAIVEGRVEDNETDEEAGEGDGDADVDAIVALF